MSAPWTGPSSITPALLTRQSSPPSSECALSTSRRPAPRRRCRSRSRRAVPPSASIRETSSSRRSLRRAASATAAPSATIATAVASPIPDEAPVISALRPSSEPAIGSEPIGGPGVAGSRRGLGGDPLGLAHRRALERVRQRPHVGARRGLEDVGGDALAAGQPPVGAQHHGHLAERVLALGDRGDGVLAQLGLDLGRGADRRRRSRPPGRRRRTRRPTRCRRASSPRPWRAARAATRPRRRTRRARSPRSRSRTWSETIASRSSAVTCFFLSAISLKRLNAWLSALPSTLKPSCSSASRSAWRPECLPSTIEFDSRPTSRRVHDLVGRALLEHAVLVDPRTRGRTRCARRSPCSAAPHSR